MQQLLDVIARAHGSFICTEDDLRGWLEQAAATALKETGVLMRKEAAGVITCPECGLHPVSPEFREVNKDGTRRYVITCSDPFVGAFDYVADLTSYVLNLERLAKTISVGLRLTGDALEIIQGQMFLLGIKQTKQGSVRCYLFLGDDIQRHKELLEESSKSASTVVLYAHTPPISFIDTVAIIRLQEVLTFSGNRIKIDETPLSQASSRLFGENSYKNGVLSVRGAPIARITSGTKLDIVLRYLSSPERIDKPIGYTAILEDYNKNKSKRKDGPEKVFGAEGWCDQTMTDLRKKCGAQDNLVENVIRRGGKKNGENTLIFCSRT